MAFYLLIKEKQALEACLWFTVIAKKIKLLFISVNIPEMLVDVILKRNFVLFEKLYECEFLVRYNYLKTFALLG